MKLVLGTPSISDASRGKYGGELVRLLQDLRRGGTKASSNFLVSRWSGGGEPQIPKPNGAALATRLGCLRPTKNTPEPQFSKLILRQSFAS